MQEWRDKVRLHREEAQRLLENAYVLLSQGEAEKAGELFWGSMAHALKAVAATKGKELRQHREIREFARAVARETQDATLWNIYTAAEHLHSDFYEVALSVEDIAATGEQVQEGVRRLLGLLEVSTG